MVIRVVRESYRVSSQTDKGWMRLILTGEDKDDFDCKVLVSKAMSVCFYNAQAVHC